MVSFELMITDFFQLHKKAFRCSFHWYLSARTRTTSLRKFSSWHNFLWWHYHRSTC